jgi:hypothetical protein
MNGPFFPLTEFGAAFSPFEWGGARVLLRRSPGDVPVEYVALTCACRKPRDYHEAW